MPAPKATITNMALLLQLMQVFLFPFSLHEIRVYASEYAVAIPL
jgi:hypothetical protein